MLIEVIVGGLAVGNAIAVWGWRSNYKARLYWEIQCGQYKIAMNGVYGKLGGFSSNPTLNQAATEALGHEPVVMCGGCGGSFPTRDGFSPIPHDCVDLFEPQP